MSEWRYDESSGSFRQYNNSPKKGDSDWFSWVLIGLLFVSGWGWWIGLILLINKLKELFLCCFLRELI